MNISELSDDELTRAMIWIDPPKLGVYANDETGIRFNKWNKCYLVNYLTDWSLTGPLMVEHKIDLTRSFTSGCYDADGQGGTPGSHQRSTNANPLRAVCECALMLYMHER